MKREKLSAFRGERSQADMAAIYGVSQQAWSKWEMGIWKPNVVIMKQLEVDSGIPMEDLFFDVFNSQKLLGEQNKQVV